MQRPRNKRARWIVVVLVLLLGGYGLFRYFSADRHPAASYDTAPVSRGRIVAKVTASGTVSALVTVQVGSQVSGRIQEILVDYNSPVKKGQVIARLDPRLFDTALAQARANYHAALTGLKRARVQAVEADREFRRTSALAARKLVAPADRDTSESNAEVAHTQIESAQRVVEQTRAALEQAQVNLAYTTIESPIDGIVVARNVDVGQTVAASLQAPTLFVIAEDLRKMQVDTTVAEADVGRLLAGMPASFVVDAYPGQPFKGVVRQIRNAAQTVQNIVTYDAVIDVANPDLKLRPGMTANATFVYAEKDNALRLRNAALRFRPGPALLAAAAKRGKGSAEESGVALAATPGRHHAASNDPTARTVWVLRDGRPVAVPVEIGISDGVFTEVKRGALRPGDPVITDAVAAGAGRHRGLL